MESIDGSPEPQRDLFALVPLANELRHRKERFLADVKPGAQGTAVIAAERQPKDPSPARFEAKADLLFIQGPHRLFPVHGKVIGQAVGAHEPADKSTGREEFGAVRPAPIEVAWDAFGGEGPTGPINVIVKAARLGQDLGHLRRTRRYV